MKISELELLLKKIREKEGDLNVCVSETDEYWGSVDSHLEEHNVEVNEHAQPEGPKSGKSEKAVRFKSW